MAKKKVKIENGEWDWKKFLWGFKRPAIALAGTLLATLALEPQWSWVAGISAERLWGTIEYYFKR